MFQASVSMTAKKYITNMKANKITFDNVYQRGLVWNVSKKSLLIHTLLTDYMVYPVVAIETDKGYDILDGQQRSYAIYDYCNNQYALSNVPPVKVEDLHGNIEEININGKKFKDLPEELRDKIEDFVINIIAFKNITQDEVRELFYRLNNGMSLSTTDLARAKNKDMETVKEIANHPIFNILFSDTKLMKKPQDEIVVKTWIALNKQTVDFSGKKYSQIMEQLVISDSQKEEIINIYDITFEALKILQLTDKNVLLLAKKKIHFLSFIRFVPRFNSPNQLAEWLSYFYNYIPYEYSETTHLSTVSVKNVRIRMGIIDKSISEFLENR